MERVGKINTINHLIFNAYFQPRKRLCLKGEKKKKVLARPSEER